MLSVHRIKKALNPVHNTIPEDDFRILESWTETDDNVDARKAKMKYFSNFLFVCFSFTIISSYQYKITIV